LLLQPKKMNSFPRLFSLFLMVSLSQLLAQGVTIGSQNSPDPSAVLEVVSQQQGFLPPRLTTTQRDSIVAPAVGLTIINTTTQCLEVFFSGGWKQAVCNCNQPPSTPSQITGSAAFCPNQTGLTYSVVSSPDASSYTWSVPAGAQITAGQGANSITVSMGSSGGTVSVLAVNTCGSSTSSTLSVSPAQPTAAFSPLSGNLNSSVNFTAGSGYATYSWTFQGGTPATSTAANPQVVWNVAGAYQVTLKVTDANGCADSLAQSVTISTCPSFSATFTTCGQTGHAGPTQSQCNAAYGSSVVTLINGIQQWVVPQTATYRIQAAGARGGGSAPGNGAVMAGDFSLTQGDVINILVGQNGTEVDGASTSSASGGGGTFVVRNNSALIIAGGGGGNQGSVVSSAHGTTSINGQNGFGSGGTGAGGTSGNGGQFSDNSGGGGGFSTDGGTGPNGGPNPGGRAYLNGGNGGDPALSNPSWPTAAGGFGGGGVATNTGWRAGGGGGGYSGGGGGNVNTNSTDCAGGGGGSINNGTNQTNQTGANAQSGFVTITRVCP
jgi:hypothetical protein